MCHFKLQYHKDGVYEWNAYGKEHKVKEEVDWFQWSYMLRKYEPFHLEITGGEPLLYKDLGKILQDISLLSSWAITSNTLLDVETIPLDKCICWTASWHGIDREQFLFNLGYLKSQVSLSVSIVVTFDKIDYWLAEAEQFKTLGYRVNLLRELNPSVNWDGTPEWNRLLMMRLNGFNVVEDDIPPNYTFESGFRCDAGNRYFCAMPDGNLYRCYSEAMLGEPIGYVGSADLDIDSHDCYSKCLACSLDYRFRKSKLTKKEGIKC
jgi:hypothetical protein